MSALRWFFLGFVLTAALAGCGQMGPLESPPEIVASD